jgi:hydroxymethylpyrimidine/phosphomethylpyrimidine kinase
LFAFRYDLCYALMPLKSRSANPQPPPTVLAIAGFDPSSGAGITADLKVFAAHGLYGIAAITALTVQSTQGVRRVEAVQPALLSETLNCLAEDMEIRGIKIGVLGSGATVEAVVRFVQGCGVRRDRIVLDPVFRSTLGSEPGSGTELGTESGSGTESDPGRESGSGTALLDRAGLKALRDQLLPLTGWITPNIAELNALVEESSSPTGEAGAASQESFPDPGQQPAQQHIPAREHIPAQVQRLAVRYPHLNIAATGGHLNPPDDFLRTADGRERWFPGQRIESKATHGTGCAFSSALLAALVLGASPVDAVAEAKDYVTRAIRSAYPIGRGNGPLNHFGDDIGLGR